MVRGKLGAMPEPTALVRPFGAVLTAMVTPMTVEGAVDFAAAVRLAEYLVENGHDGLVINGTTGESPTTHAAEKADLVRAVVDVVGDRAKIVAGAGSNDTAHSVRMAESATDAGADGLLIVTPYYSKPSQVGIIRHTLELADATDLPVMLYDIPGRSAIRLAPSTLEALAAHEQIVAVKDATGDVPGAARSMARTGMAWYSGDDPLNLAFLAHGAAGVVSVAGHVLGPQLAAMVRHVDAGDLASAREVYTAMTPVVDAIMGSGLGAVMAKAAVQLLGLLDSRAVRLPQVEATEQEVAALRTALVAAGLLHDN